MNIKRILRLFTPPIIINIIKKIISQKKEQVINQPTGEKDADFYNEAFSIKDHYKNIYYKSPYYFIWTVIIDRLIYQEITLPQILELGCGTGQLAKYFQESGVKKYIGVDFSKVGIKLAMDTCIGYDFICQDLFDFDFSKVKYDTIICCETLEHIENDIWLIKQVMPGTRFIGSVPDFAYISHVRYFKNEKEVIDRYKSLFIEFKVERFFSPNGDCFFLMDGIVN